MREPFDGARSTLNLLFNIEVFLGVALLTVTTIYLFRIDAFLGAKENKILLGQLLHFQVLGLVIILVNVASLQLWKRLWEIADVNLHTVVILNLWLCFNVLIFICGLCTLWCLTQCASELVTIAETALIVGIDKYDEFPEWKLRWDELQINQQCCGVNSYDDWQTAIWLPTEAAFNRGLKTRAPYSCCRKGDSGCYKEHGPTTMPILPVEVINTNGCIPIFKRYLNRLINLLWGILLLALFFQLCIWFLVKFIVKNQSSTFGQDFGSNDQVSNGFANQQHSEIICDCEHCRAAQQDSCP